MGWLYFCFNLSLILICLRTDCRNEQHKFEVLVELYHLLTVGQSIIFCKVAFIHLLVLHTNHNSFHSDEIKQTKSLAVW